MKNYTKKELIEILQDDSINDEIFSVADQIRKEYVGDEVHLRGMPAACFLLGCFLSWLCG